MSDQTISVLEENSGKAAEAASQSPSKLLTNAGFEHLDLSDATRDKSLSIHQLGSLSIHCGEAVGNVCVFDFEHVYVHTMAKLAIKNAYITPLFLVEAFAQNYRDHLLRKLTRGNDKGLLVLDPKVSTYVHRLSDGSELVVQGETVEVNGTYTRHLTISCRNEQLHGGAQ
jgi:hypothetical protein